MPDTLAADPRVRIRRAGQPDPDGTCVVYWMRRAQRAVDNPALDVAIELGNALRKPVVVFFGLHPRITHANLRHYHFLVEGLADVAAGLRRRRVGLVLRRYPSHRLLKFVEEVRPALVVGDENPLRQFEAWRHDVTTRLQVPFWTVDADVVVPSAILAKEQYAARTIRPRLHARLDEFLVPSTDVVARTAWRRPRGLSTMRPSLELLQDFPISRAVSPVSGLRGGTLEARRLLGAFVRQRLGSYPRTRNHPECTGTSQLSPYLHFGHIGPREVARAIRDSGASPEAIAAFLEQLIVRRELAINFVTFNRDYDRLDGCESWARATLNRHRNDRREYVYKVERLEGADTHDPLWNAAQMQMATTGWMHGYVRMYWAKKILEWAASPEEAFETAVMLNDKYELDGRDPNGYANIAWAIGGKHDRPWPTRPIFGSIRAMSYGRTVRKFEAAQYISRFLHAPDTQHLQAYACDRSD
jgi:deoxyribodipyrimidine photo-lyase